MKEEEAKTVIKEYLYNHRFGYIAKDAEFDRLYEAMKVAIQALEQEPRYCDRNICLRNEYNGIGCDECEVTKSQEPCEDAISRQALLKLMGEEPFNWTDSEQELQAVEDYRNFRNMVEQLPSVKPQEPKKKKYDNRWFNGYAN